MLAPTGDHDVVAQDHRATRQLVAGLVQAGAGGEPLGVRIEELGGLEQGLVIGRPADHQRPTVPERHQDVLEPRGAHRADRAPRRTRPDRAPRRGPVARPGATCPPATRTRPSPSATASSASPAKGRSGPAAIGAGSGSMTSEVAV